MKGDFSHWDDRRPNNFSGVLQQQGRALIDTDFTAQTLIVTDWQDSAAEDIIGAAVAAVPEDLPNSFKIDHARVQGGDVIVTVDPGRVWADGLLVHLPEDAVFGRVATYLRPPVQDPPADVTTIAAGVRDAVVLEVWRESVNAFQLPDLLIEPALGGPDTAERMFTAAAFRLYRMADGDTCSSIAIADDFSTKGQLTVSLEPTTATPGDCPVVEGGGYTGFEHHLYRVEIADITTGEPMFKWSRFNGGLVGRGVFDAAARRLNITANLAAITSSGLSQFYLEVEEFDDDRGVWTVTYGAPVTLNSSNQLVLPAVATFGAIPSSPNSVFFRLWDGIKAVSAFPNAGAPVELEDGIRLEFDAPPAAQYSPRDYWTFAVRAGGIGNPAILIDAQPPQGIVHHRVALGVITWNAARDVGAAAGQISDCRHTFGPLTSSAGCCTVQVREGQSIQKAIDSLPAEGGEVCIMAGTYRQHVVIKGRRNIRVHGCGPRTVVAPEPGRAAAPAIHIVGSRGITVDSLAIQAEPQGAGILLDGADTAAADDAARRAVEQIAGVRDVTLLNLRITAAARSAIEAHDAATVAIEHCDIRMLDVPGAWPGIFFTGDDSVLARNQIRVRSRRQTDDGSTWPLPASAAIGGLQIGGTSDDVRIIDNLIQGGIGNGITLGSVLVVDRDGNDTHRRIGWVVNPDDPCNPCKPGTVVFPPARPEDGSQTISAGALSAILIERNRILDMGLNGIGVAAFFDLEHDRETISVTVLSILGNIIRGCLRRPIEDIPAAMVNRAGYGGIALADVETLVVYDNTIENNGPRRIDPVCGIFVLLGEGIEIARNTIVNNGARTEEPVTSAKPGQRGGIIIVHAMAPHSDAPAVNPARFASVAAQSGRPAVRVHDNVVVAPLGRALSLTALGPVSVVANELVSQGVIWTRSAPIDAVIAATVFIGNLGRSVDSSDWRAGFRAIRLGNFQNDHGYAVDNAAITLAPRGVVDPAVRLFQGGQVLFSDNQVTLDLVEAGASRAASSITIHTLDDIAFHVNQSMAYLADDYLTTNTLLFGSSLRAIDNRWEEPVGNAAYSAMTLGMMNATVNNIATHCIVALAPPKLLIPSPNIVLLNQFADDPCALNARILAHFGAIVGQGQ